MDTNQLYERINMVIADAEVDVVVTLDKYVKLQLVVNPFYIMSSIYLNLKRSLTKIYNVYDSTRTTIQSIVSELTNIKGVDIGELIKESTNKSQKKKGKIILQFFLLKA